MPDVTYVPIGVDCQVAHYLRRRRLRHHAFPFDWTVTPVLAALRLIENDFQEFLDPQNLVFLPPQKRLLFREDDTGLHETGEIITPVVCRKYGILFPHDFSAAGMDDLAGVQEKYAKRIARLQELKANGRTLTLIYHCGAVNEWQAMQLKKSGASVPSTSPAAVKQLFARGYHPRSELLSLDQLTARTDSRSHRAKALFKRWIRR